MKTVIVHLPSKIFSIFIFFNIYAIPTAIICISLSLSLPPLSLSLWNIALLWKYSLPLYYLPPLWTFTRPVVYSYFNFKSYSYFIPVSYFRNILSSLPEGLSTGHSKGIHFIPLRFIPLFSIRTRLNYSLVSCICFINVYTYIALTIKRFVECIIFFQLLFVAAKTMRV